MYRYGYMNSMGEVVIELQYRDAEDFSCGLAYVKTFGGKEMFIDTLGREQIDVSSIQDHGIVLASASFEGDGVCVVMDGYTSMKGLMDRAGRLCLPCKYEAVYPISGAVIVQLTQTVSDSAGRYLLRKCIVLDSAGRELAAITGANPFKYGEGLIVMGDWCTSSGPMVLYGYADMLGVIRIRHKYGLLSEAFHSGLATVQDPQTRLRGVINRCGEYVVQPSYHGMGTFSDGLIIAQRTKDGPWGAITSRGETAIPFEYERCTNFNEGLASARKDGAWFIIDVNGRIAVPLVFFSEEGWYGPAAFRGNVSSFLSESPEERTYFNREGKILWKAAKVKSAATRIVPYEEWQKMTAKKGETDKGGGE